MINPVEMPLGKKVVYVIEPDYTEEPSRKRARRFKNDISRVSQELAPQRRVFLDHNIFNETLVSDDESDDHRKAKKISPLLQPENCNHRTPSNFCLAISKRDSNESLPVGPLPLPPRLPSRVPKGYAILRIGQKCKYVLKVPNLISGTHM